MPRVIGYGEDALTYWALTEKLEYILQKLGDKSNPSDCLVMYRPSFARKGGFGEFDAILATPHSIYLIESKWDGSSKFKEGIKLEVKNTQVNRHRIFIWYFKHWNKEDFQSWSSFVERYESEFSNEFNGKKIASPRTKLSGNLEYVINQLHRYSKEISDVLLFFRSKESFPPNCVNPPNFQLVIVDYQKLCGGDYFKM